MDRPNSFNQEKNQDSQGGLITLDSEDKEQDSRGELKNSQTAEFVSSPPNIIELATNEIKPFQIIPDYDSSTISPFPIVVKSHISCHCIDGWDKVELSLIQNQPTLTCHVFYIPEYCETEIAIRKAAIRTMPQGGTCSYAELVRNAGILFKMLMASIENPVVFSHGGSRRGASYADNKENNIRTLLANRLGKSPVTINKYLNHGDFINDETMQELINADVEKGFFEINQVHKRSLIDRLKADQIPDDDIIDAVSQLVLSLLNNYRQPEPVEISGGQSDLEEASAVENQREQAEASRSNPRIEEFKHWCGNENSEADAPATEEDILQRIKMVGSLLIETADNTELTIQDRVETYTIQNFELSRLIQGLIHLMNENGIKGEDQG